MRGGEVRWVLAVVVVAVAVPSLAQHSRANWGRQTPSQSPRRHHAPATPPPTRRSRWEEVSARHHDPARPSIREAWAEGQTRGDTHARHQDYVPRLSSARHHVPATTRRREHYSSLRRTQAYSQRRPRKPVISRDLPVFQSTRQHQATLHNAIPDQHQQQQHQHQQTKRWQKAQQQHRPASSTASTTRRDRRPNIVLIMTDDQDVELGSLNYMPYLMEQLRDQGALFPNAYCSTPICCPSRSSLLTGLYIHNHEVYTNNRNCSSYHWQQTHERRSFATYLANAGYRTGYFGKYLNKYNGSHIPAGWHEWAGLIKNSRYYNYTVMRNGHFIKYGDQYPRDYYPHVITNEGLQFLKKSRASMQPMMLVLSYPAPHGPEDSAPEHSHQFFNATDHNTLSYNYAPNPDKQWLLQFTGRMQDIEVKFTDILMTKRLQTLQTVDESVAKVVNALQDLGELDNTYIFYTSDHGYHLGQFGLVKGKSMPFEFDIKVPFLVRGPGIKPGVQVNNIALNIDLAPTFLDIAGVKPPAHMDGRSLLPVLSSTWNNSEESLSWRDSFLVESSGRHREEDALELREARRRNRAQGLSESSITGGLYTSKRERLEIICQSEEYRAPCSPGQKWECVQEMNRWRLHKCRKRKVRGPKVKWRRRNCVCEPDLGMGYLVRLDSAERRKQRTFLKKHLTQDLRTFNTKFIKVFSDVDSQELMEQSLLHVSGRKMLLPRSHHTSARQRRSTRPEQVGAGHMEEDVVDAFVKDEEIRDLDVTINTLSDELESLESNIAATVVSANTSTSLPESHESLRHGCRVTGSTVGCTDDVYRDPQAWRLSKVAIDQQIRRLRHQLIVMKDIRKHLRDARPDSLREYDDYEDDDDVAADYTTGLDGLEDTTAAPTTTSTTTTSTTTATTNATRLHSVEPEEESGMGASTTPPDVTMASVTPAGVDVVEEEEEEEQEVGRQSGGGGGDGGGATNLEEADEVVIYGTDYSTGSSQESQGEEEESKETQAGVEDEVGGGWGSAGHLPLSTNRFEVFPVHAATGRRQTAITLENETSAQEQCWCNRKLEQKLVERDRKRQERQKLRQERQSIKQRRREIKEKKKMRKIKNNLAQCNYTMLNCYTHDNDHWRTPPLWHDGKFCFCMNAINNTYWCVRTINQTHNFLYCEFITGLVTYYDLNIDPYQLRNVAFTLSNKRLAELHRRLEALRTCAGAAHCDDLPEASQSTTASAPQLDLHHEESQLEENEEHDPGDNRVEVMEVSPRRGKEERRRLREERQRHREERRRLRKEHKKWKRHQLQALRGHRVLQSTGSNKNIIRLPRKSRAHGRRRDGERRREKRRERRRRKKSRKVRIS
ncbi:extracellular sulfatase Sulf-1-like isoform X2 [Scylla paramamosain]|uniref:extracellular sulfatase Sulf-1-like isoform X2 n=1 Tax=Scylla paramamosain TaxID=85552 RepID=UPI0030830346